MVCAQGSLANTQVRTHTVSDYGICYLNCCLLPDPIPVRKEPKTKTKNWAEGS